MDEKKLLQFKGELNKAIDSFIEPINSNEEKFKKEIAVDRTNPLLFQETMVSRFFNYAEYVLDPYEYIQAKGGQELIDKIYMDDEISTVIDTRIEAAINSQWVLEGGTDVVNQFITSQLKDFFTPIANESIKALLYGYNVFEVVYERSAGRFQWSYIKVQKNEDFKIQRDGKIVYRSAIGQDSELIPEKWFATVRKPSYRHPMGQSLFARLIYLYFLKCNALDYFVRMLETWGKPFIHLKTDSSDSALIENYRTLINSKRPRGVITDKDTELDVIQATGDGAAFNSFLDLVTKRIHTTVLGQNLTTNTDTNGSRAQAEVHDRVRMDKKLADCNMMARTFQRMIDILHSLNNFAGESPKFKFTNPKGLEKERAERDSLLLRQGVRFTEQYFKNNYDFNDGDFELVEPQTNSFLDFSDPNLGELPDECSHTKFAEVPKEIQINMDLEKEYINDAGEEFSFEELSAVIKSAKSEKDLEKKLASLGMKDATKFAEEMTNGLYQQAVKGLVDAKEKV